MNPARTRVAVQFGHLPTILYDEQVSGDILVPGEVDEFTFNGASGDRLFFDFGGLDTDFFAPLYAPSGATLFDSFANNHDALLPETGTYTLEIDGRDAATSSYSFEFISVPAPTTQTIQLDDVGSGEFFIPGEIANFEIDLVAGQQIYVDTIGGLGSDSHMF